jgi:hypothetical protein
MNNQRLYEDKDGIQYKCIGFSNNQFKMKVVDSPYPNIQEGVVEWMNELPQVVDKGDEEFKPVYNLNEI